MEDMFSDDPATQSVPLGSVFIAIAIIVWTSVAIWLCYSGPPSSDSSGDSELDGQLADGSDDLSICKGFTELLLDGKDKLHAGSQCDARSLDLFKLEELLTPSKASGAVPTLKKAGLATKDARFLASSDRQGLLNKVTSSAMAKGLLSKVAGSGAVKDGNWHPTPLAGLSLGSDKDWSGCDPRTTPSPARISGDLEGRPGRRDAASGLDDDVVGDRSDFAGLSQQLREKLSASLNNGARKPADPLELVASPARSRVEMTEADILAAEKLSRGSGGGASAKREALEDFLKQLLHPPGSSLRGDDKLAKVRGKLPDPSELSDDKEANQRPATMLSMAEHAKEVGNKYMQDRHFAAATHCYEVACLLYPAGVSNAFLSTTGAGGVALLTSGPGGTVPAAGTPGQLAAYHCNCALACLELGRYGDAINEGNAALVLTPPKHLAVKALYRLAVAHANLKNAFEARRCLRKCLDLDPLNEYAKAFLTRLGDEETPNAGGKHELRWVDPPKRVQCLGAVAREKAKGRKAKQKSGGSAADEHDAVGGKDSEVRLDREASLWHSMARHNNKLYILGGWSDGVSPPGAPPPPAPSGSLPIGKGDASNGHSATSPEPAAHGSDELHVFDVDTFELRQLSGPNSKPPHPCYCHTATMVGGSMVVFGGCGPPSDQPATVMVFDVQQAKWRTPQTVGTPPRQRQGHSANVVQGDRHLCVFGGIEPTEQHRVARVYNDAHLLDLQSYAWRKLEVGGHRPPARFGHTATNLPGNANKLLIVGGRDHLGGGAGPVVSGGFTGLHILDTERRVWTQQAFSGAPPLQAFYHTACVLDETTVLFLTSGTSGTEGSNGSATLPLYLLDVEAWHWSSPRASGLGPAPHIGHTASLVGSRVYMFGGVVMRGKTPTADKAVYVLDASQPRPAERDAPQVPERPVAAHVSTSHGAAKGEKFKGEKAKGDAAKAATATPSTLAQAVSASASADRQASTTTSPTATAATASATGSARSTASTVKLEAGMRPVKIDSGVRPATPPAAGSGVVASSEAPPKKRPVSPHAAPTKERPESGSAREEGSGRPVKAERQPDSTRSGSGGLGAKVAQGPKVLAKPSVADVLVPLPPAIAPLAVAAEKHATVPSSRANTAPAAAKNAPARAAARPAGDSNHHAKATTASTQPPNGRSANAKEAGSAAKATKSSDDGMDALFPEDGFDDDEELSFEQLLEQEKAYFQAQKEKISFPRSKEIESGGNSGNSGNSGGRGGGGGGGGSGKKGHKS